KRKAIFSDFYDFLIMECYSPLLLMGEFRNHIHNYFDNGLNIKFFDESFHFSDDPNNFEQEFVLFMYVIKVMLNADLHLFRDWEGHHWNERVGGADNLQQLETQILERSPRLSSSEVRYAAMKVIFHAGKMIERLKQEGQKRSDRPAKIGRLPKKNMVDYKDVIDAFFRTDREGKSKHAICVAVRKYLVEKEARRGTRAKKVYSVKQIGRILEPVFNK
ncbi:MAG: hypothetical protein JXB23_11360, partial [Candidatus Aminicenantes bacterium]|nr:hypothetical protein [Candidatus Aminicenantes bacterium]